MKYFILIFLLATNASLIQAMAAEGVRTWTSNTGSKLSAELVSAAGGKVALKTDEGRVINLRLDQLSKADQEYLASLDKKKPATDTDAGKTEDAVSTVVDPEAWYASEIGDKDAFVTEFPLKAGRKQNFEVPAPGMKKIFVGFTAKEGSVFVLATRPGMEEFVAVIDGDGGKDFTVKSGKVRLTIHNQSEVDTHVMIYTRKKDQGDK